MTTLTLLFLLALCFFASGVFSGSETGLYSLSRLRVEALDERRQRSARVIRALLRDDVGLLITLLVANNLTVQLTTHVGDRLLRPFPVPPGTEELVLTLLLTPPLFFLGELLPKDLFRRRPHALVGVFAPVIALVKGLLLPLTVPLRLLTGLVERMLGLDSHEVARVHGREAVLELLRAESGPLARPTESLARNVLALRRLRVERVMVPWSQVDVLPAAATPAEAYERVGRCPYTRLPVVDAEGRVRGYVHQLEVLVAGREAPLEGSLRPMVALDPSTPLDRALSRLRQSGQRAALVGSPEAPLGLVTLKDLVEEISGELHRW